MKSTSTKSKVISLLLRLSEEEKKALKLLAQKENRTMAGWIKNKIHTDIEKQGKPILNEN